MSPEGIVLEVDIVRPSVRLCRRHPVSIDPLSFLGCPAASGFPLGYLTLLLGARCSRGNRGKMFPEFLELSAVCLRSFLGRLNPGISHGQKVFEIGNPEFQTRYLVIVPWHHCLMSRG